MRWRTLGMRWVRVVDNGSTDRTSAIAKEAGAEVFHEPKRGYGAAVWSGLQRLPAGCEWVLFSSADGSDRLTANELLDWAERVHGTSLVIGDRTYFAESREQLKRIQQWGNTLLSWALWVGWGRQFRDLGSLRLLRCVDLEKLEMSDRGFGWNVEMQARAVELGLGVVEIPVHYYPREKGDSKISGSWKGSFRAAWGMLRILGQLTIWRFGRKRSNSSSMPSKLTAPP